MKHLNTIQDLINYLKTLDPDKHISAEYIHIIGSSYIGLEKRPLLSDLICNNDNNDAYIWRAMFY